MAPPHGTEEEEEEQAATLVPMDAPKEPSFQGRLQLKDFMFVSQSNGISSPPATRRSSRHAASPSGVLPSGSPPSPSKTASKPRKRKAGESESITRTTDNSSRSTPTLPPSSSASSPGPTDTTTTTATKRSRKGGSSGYAPPSTYAHLPLLPDAVAPGLLILFVGLNPGLQTARTGHAYAHPSNLFWKLLHASGITPTACAAREDRELPRRHALGLTNLVARPSRSGAELSRAEMDAGVAALDAKCARWRPEVACVVGKGIWESVFRVRRGRPLAKGEFRYGWQEEEEDGEGMRLGVVEDEGAESEGGKGRWGGARIFVASSTSGLAATLRPEEKERIWKELGDWCVRRRKEREEDAAGRS